MRQWPSGHDRIGELPALHKEISAIRSLLGIPAAPRVPEAYARVLAHAGLGPLLHVPTGLPTLDEPNAVRVDVPKNKRGRRCVAFRLARDPSRWLPIMLREKYVTLRDIDTLLTRTEKARAWLGEHVSHKSGAAAHELTRAMALSFQRSASVMYR